MTPEGLIAIAVPVLGIVGGIAVYSAQKAMDRENEIRHERRTLYRDFVRVFDMVHGLVLHEDQRDQVSSGLADLSRISAELAVSAPDSVVLAVEGAVVNLQRAAICRFSDEFADTPDLEKAVDFSSKANDEFRQAIIAMRKDTFDKTHVTTRVIEGLVAKGPKK